MHACVRACVHVIQIKCDTKRSSVNIQLLLLKRLPVLHSSRYTPRLTVYPEIKSYEFSNGKALQNNSSLLIFTHTIQTHRLRNNS